MLPPSKAQAWLAHSKTERDNMASDLEILKQIEKELGRKFKRGLTGWEKWTSTKPFSEYKIDHAGNVVRIRITGTELNRIPASIGQLTNLQGLYVRYNQLTSLPASIGQLTNLQWLDVSSNQLTSLPDSIVQLTNLQWLDVNSNQLTSLPDSIGQPTNLQWLHVHSNQLTSLPEALVDTRDAKKILEYYFRTRVERQPLNEAKLILLGHGTVGKTCLVNRLVYDKFNKDEKKTEGIKITQWPIRLNGNEDVRLNIWDFGGQEMMHSTHQFFLTQRSLYLLVLNGRQGHEDADAEYWLNLIQSFGEDSPVIVVLNKVKEHPFDLNRRYLRQKFPMVRDFIETDCEDRTGMSELRKAIERETDRLEHLRDVFPASWFSIKDRLAGMKENYLSFDRYRDICADNGEKNGEDQELLAYYLHCLGIALNYKDDPRLRDMHVLNPRWVTSGIYTILNAKDLAKQRGELRVTDLARILDKRQYPPERHGFLLELMRKFELCFNFPDSVDCFLIPELLAKDEPADTDAFDLTECLNFQYHYPILPEGLLSRFIVRTHVLSTGKPRWRTGVILEFEGNRALVKADVQDKFVSIAVTGPTPSRRRLLAVIRSDFEHIHSSFKFEPKEMVPVPRHPDVLVSYEDLLVMERGRRSPLPKVIDGEVVDLNVPEMLNGVDLEGIRRILRKEERMTGALNLFFSYSHKDEELRNELETHLKLLQRQGLILSWHDRMITAGDEWKGEIDDNLDRADIILLLVSANFTFSDYCYDIEMERAMKRHEAGEARVIPVIVRDVSWHSAPFGKLQALPTDGKAVTLWPDRDTAWRNVADGIKKVIRQAYTRRM